MPIGTSTTTQRCRRSGDNGRMTEPITADRIRSWATALPEVTEKLHFRFKVPQWQVRGKTFLGMGRDEATVVFCLTESSAQAQVVAFSEAALVRRPDARNSFLGMEVPVRSLQPSTARRLVEDAWAAQAPRTLIKQRTAWS